MDADEARDALMRASAAGVTARRVAHADRGRHAWFTAGVGVAMALYLLATTYLIPRNTALFVVALVVYVGFILGICFRFNRVRRAAPEGWSRAYSISFGLTFALYAAGIAVNALYEVRSTWVWVLWSAVTAVPMVVTAVRTVRGAGMRTTGETAARTRRR